MSHEFRYLAMRAVAIVLGLYAIIWGVAPYASINISARFLLDILDWPLDSMADDLDRNTMWLSAIGAGLLGSLAVILWGIVAPALRDGNLQIAKTTFIAFMVWYIIDGAGSVAVGVTSNVVFNTIYLVFMVLPLVGISKADKPLGSVQNAQG